MWNVIGLYSKGACYRACERVCKTAKPKNQNKAHTTTATSKKKTLTTPTEEHEHQNTKCLRSSSGTQRLFARKYSQMKAATYVDGIMKANNKTRKKWMKNRAEVKTRTTTHCKKKTHIQAC